ncbi:MAG: peptidyl-alpha-hydroxyglycine alpha-amidating lyase family protein [Vicinamibacterales bacterium]|nr:hypothetical protein [Acidobacteriota bacterium]MDP7671887.1 peptidyl-alpha-hydroxyglycine alpha-amidating lyase family protein [Vicinamibacterales bacterium]HJO37728.1 peptidyl-alpha-hydroxyglycine alpha-amidating lyase family protein [Vicinamibacterales bacterium]
MQQRRPIVLTLALAICAAAVPTDARAQSSADMEPVNDRPNPYRTVDDHFMMPIAEMPRAGEPGRTWGSMPAMDTGIDGTSIWVTERCGANSCIGSEVPAVHRFDASGKLVTSFGAGMFAWPHGIHVDQKGNVWVTDGRSATPEELEQFPDAADKGHTVFKFSPDGELLMTLGTPGIAGDPPDRLNEPCDVLIAPNGDILVAEGHSGQSQDPGPTVVSRISRFTKDGAFIDVIGTLGSGPGEFKTPHAIAFDSSGRLIVADRGNDRIQILDQDGTYLDEWYQFSRPSGLFIDANDMLYVADGESSPDFRDGGLRPVAGARWREWLRGIRIGSLRDGKVIYFIPEAEIAPEGVAVDAAGNVYGGEVLIGTYNSGKNQRLKKFVKR